MKQRSRITAYFCVVLTILLVPATVLSAQELESTPGSDASSDSGPDFGMLMGLGAVNFVEDDGSVTTWQNLALKPEFYIDKFGIGLSLDLNFRFTGGDENNEFEVRAADWVPSEAGLSFLELYLPKFRFISWDRKGAPLHAKIGLIDNALLGNGFILGNYANDRFLPNQRNAGLSFDLDGKLFDFPLIGLETFVGNLAALDVLGGRLFLRPLSFFDIPIIDELQLGATVVVDTQPFYYADKDEDAPLQSDSYTASENKQALVWGVDLIQPILSSQIVSLIAFGDIVNMNNATGGQIGVKGSLFGFLGYSAQVRVLGDGFIPTYFDRNYDLRRVEKFQAYNQDAGFEIPGYSGYGANLGFSFLDDTIGFGATLSGPFEVGSNRFLRPVLQAQLYLREGLVDNVSFMATFEKFNIGDPEAGSFLEDAIIEARLNYSTGGSTLSLVYDLKYKPENTPDPWEITSNIEASISLIQ